MELERHYFISDDLDDLEHVEAELIKCGITAPQIHVLSRDNANVQRHDQLSGVTSFMKRDTLHLGLIGAMVGTVLALIVVWVTFFAGWQKTPAGWMPFLFLALALFGASTWVGGLWGFQKPNHHFQRFQSVLDEGKHVLLIDLDPEGREGLKRVCSAHERLEFAGIGEAVPAWAVAISNYTGDWWYWRMWKNA